MKDKFDYSKYKCPYEYLSKECGHELNGPEGCGNVYSVWCACGYRGPVFYLDPKELKLELKDTPQPKQETVKECDHEWVSARNKVIKSGLLCIKCNRIKPEV